MAKRNDNIKLRRSKLVGRFQRAHGKAVELGRKTVSAHADAARALLELRETYDAKGEWTPARDALGVKSATSRRYLRIGRWLKSLENPEAVAAKLAATKTFGALCKEADKWQRTQDGSPDPDTDEDRQRAEKDAEDAARTDADKPNPDLTEGTDEWEDTAEVHRRELEERERAEKDAAEAAAREDAIAKAREEDAAREASMRKADEAARAAQGARTGSTTTNTRARDTRTPLEKALDSFSNAVDKMAKQLGDEDILIDELIDRIGEERWLRGADRINARRGDR